MELESYSSPVPTNPAYYEASVVHFLQQSRSEVVGLLAQANPFHQQLREQTIAWSHSVEALQTALSNLSQRRRIGEWKVLLEFPIARRQKRIDAVLLTENIVIVIEIKDSESADVRAGLEQVQDYVSELLDFHETSRNLRLIPLLVMRELPKHSQSRRTNSEVCSYSELAEFIEKLADENAGVPAIPNRDEWARGRYFPVPTIIRAATDLYKGMDITEVAHSQASGEDIHSTCRALKEIILLARQSITRSVVFVTGVPGAGKTLVGLNTAHSKELNALGLGIHFMSGNGPLVQVLTHVLADAIAEEQQCSHNAALKSASFLIRDIHRFARECFGDEREQFDRVVIFDEAQRAWSRERNLKKWKRDISEPNMILDIMERKDWAVLVCLVGGGQEIHTGEAGLAEWGRALSNRGERWKIFASPEALSGGASVAGTRLFVAQPPVEVHSRPELHLAAAVRNIRCESVSNWTHKLLAGDMDGAAEVARLQQDFPIFCTRDLSQLKNWLRNSKSGSQKSGLVASAKAKRLLADGLDVSSAFDEWNHWFLKKLPDVRSSDRLEIVATEFAIQGLELDWIGFCWGGDLVWRNDRWVPRTFRPGKSDWSALRDTESASYRLNSYRVLLTRARRATAIFVPKGDPNDPTIPPLDYDQIAEVLIAAGARPLNSESTLERPLRADENPWSRIQNWRV